MTSAEFISRARVHLLRIVLLFFASYGLAAFLAWIALWAEDKSGWPSVFIYYVFMGAATVPMFSAFYFFVSIFSWFGSYRSGLSNLSTYAADPEWWLAKHRAAIGPIAWR